MKKIVVAESSPTIKSVTDNLLRQNGFEVICTSDGLQAWEIINSESPDLVLAGLNISGLNGLELCKQVTRDSKLGGIPVVVMVGAKDRVSEEELISSGARGKLKKPFSPRDVLIIVSKLLGQGEQADQSNSASPGLSKSSGRKPVEADTTEQLENAGNGIYNLDWNDLSVAATQKAQDPTERRRPDYARDDQEIEIMKDQFDLGSLNLQEDLDEPVKKAKTSDDEDYDWFVGEIKKEVSGNSADTRAGSTNRDESESTDQRDILPDNKGEIQTKYESDNAAIFAAGKSKTENKTAAPTVEIPHAKTANRGISEEEIARIADKVTQNLASALAAKIDNKKIIEAIKAVIKK